MNTDLRVGDVMNRNPKVISPDSKVSDAVRLMAKHKVGSLVVVENSNKPVGIFTEKDVVEQVVLKGLDPEKTRVSDTMHSPLLTVPQSMGLKEIMKLMSSRNVHRFPVVDEKKLVGIITYKDIIRASPALFEVLEEQATINNQEKPVYFSEPYSGKCEECGMLTDYLILKGERFLCEECASTVEQEEQKQA
jgi:CBS domain-containing protein